jgi:hypothetical protein
MEWGGAMILHSVFDLITAFGRDPDASASWCGRFAATAEHLLEGAQRSQQVRTDVGLVVVHDE